MSQRRHKKVVITTIDRERRWIDIPREFRLAEYPHGTGPHFKCPQLYLDEYFESVDPRSLTGFKGSLLEHQLRAVAAMRDIELRGAVPAVFDTAGVPSLVNDKIQVLTNAARLSEPLGSGKTYEVIALLCLNRELPPRAEITTLCYSECYQNGDLVSEMRKTYERFLPATLVVVSKSVLIQWRHCLAECSNLRVFVLDGVVALRAFHALLLSREGFPYDVVLMKCGTITAKFEGVTSTMVNRPSHSLVRIISDLCYNVQWRRVVLDDFDTLDIPWSCPVIPAAFTWFVSATNKAQGVKYSVKARLPRELLLLERPLYYNVNSNELIHTVFNISSTAAYVQLCVDNGLIKFCVYRFTSPHDHLIGALRELGNSGREVAEMLNGDAVQEAALVAGGARDVDDIFAKVLGKEWDRARRARRSFHYSLEVAAAIAGAQEANLLLKPDLRESIRKNLYNAGPLDALLHLICDKKDDALLISAEGHKMLNEECLALSKEFHNSTIIWRRVHDNLSEGSCPILCTPLAESPYVVILRCCGKLICFEAINYIYQAGGKCFNCFQPLKAENFLFVSREAELKSAAYLQEAVPNAPLSAPIQKAPTAQSTRGSMKVQALIDLLQGKAASEIRPKGERTASEGEGKHIYPKVMRGTRDLGFAPPGQRKYLIFANFKETLDAISAALKRHKIAYHMLYGTAEQIAQLVTAYCLPATDPKAINMLIVNGAKHCAGLNLQVTTDLIFAHRVESEEVEQQIIGRVMRYGRTSNLTVHFLFYANEAEASE